MRREHDNPSVAEAAVWNFLDPRWDVLGEPVLRKWIRSHPHVAIK